MIEWTAVLSAVAEITAIMFILLQLWHMDRHRDLKISMKLFDWAETESLRKALRWVEKKFQFENYEKYRSEMEEDSEVSDYPYRVKAFFEEVGFYEQKISCCHSLEIRSDRERGFLSSNSPHHQIPLIFLMEQIP